MAKPGIKVSDGSVNSYGFAVSTSGINLERFKTNSVFLFNHDTDDVIGRISDIWVDGDSLYISEPTFDEKDPEAADIKRKYDEGFIKGFSIGIEPIVFGIANDVDTVTESELLEISLCPIPSNKNAIRLYAKDGSPMDEKTIKLAVAELKPSNQNQTTNMKKQMLLTLAAAGIQHSLTEASTDEQFADFVKGQLITLKAKEAELNQKIADHSKKRASDLITLAVSQGKIKEENKAKWVERAERDYDMTADTLEQIPATAAPVTLSVDLNAILGKGSEGATGADASRKDWTIRDWEKKDSAGLQLMAKTQPELYKKLEEATYGLAKMFVVALIAMASVFFGFADNAQAQSNPAGGISKGGLKQQFQFADGIAANTLYNFPSFELQTKAYDDTITVTMKNLETYVNIASLTGTVRLVIEISSSIQPGAKLWINIAGTDTTRAVTVVNSASLISETVSVTAATRRSYLYTGSAIVLLTKTP